MPECAEASNLFLCIPNQYNALFHGYRNGICQMKVCMIFLICAPNIDFGCFFASLRCPQSCVLIKVRQIMHSPVNLFFHPYILQFGRVLIAQACQRDVWHVHIILIYHIYPD